MPASADQPFDVRLHENLQHALGDGPEEIAIASLLQEFG